VHDSEGPSTPHLHTDEYIAKLLAKDEQLLAVGVELAGRLAPVLFQVLRVVAQLLVLVHL